MRLRGLILVAALGLVAAACSGGSSIAEETAGSSTTTQPSSSGTSDGTSTSPGMVEGDLTFSVADGYTARWIAEGIKPDLALAADGAPGIAYLVEDLAGHIAYSDVGSGWSSEHLIDGYFYGPIGLAYGSDGEPRVAYHDHQDVSFDEEKGDLTVAVRGDGQWTIEAIPDVGHDGWDSTIAIGADGVVRAAGIDPQQFGRTEGVEYFELTGAGWQVTEIGSGPVAYEFNVSLAVDPEGDPALTYYDSTAGELRYAARSDGTWSIETVDADGDVGRYSSLAFDASGAPHISYLRLDGATTGTVRYATRDGDRWTTSDVDTLSALRTGFTGARRVTAIAIDSDQQPHVVYSDESVVKRAVPDGQAWQTSSIVTAGERPLGQLVSFALDSNDVLHLAVFEVTLENPLQGVVGYLTAS